MKRQQIKKQNIFQLILTLLIIILISYISSFVFLRFDLTSEKRYTLSNTTKEMLKELDDVVFVKVYLEGDLPYGFKRLQKSTREMLDEFRIYAKNKLEYEFIDPSAEPKKKERYAVYDQLNNKGLKPVNLQYKETVKFH